MIFNSSGVTQDQLEKKADKATTLSGYGITDAENKRTVLQSTLSAGATSVSFNHSKLTNTALIDIYSSKYGVNPKEVHQENGLLTLTFDSQQENITVAVEVH